MPSVHTYQTEADWLRARNQGIGASEIAAACGASHYQTPMQLLASKLGIRRTEVSARMRWGNLMEAVAESIYREHCDNPSADAEQPEHITSPSPFEVWWRCAGEPAADWLFATPDAMQQALGQRTVVDYKIVSPMAKEWQRNGAPPEYELQIQQQMMATGATHGVLCALVFAHRMDFDPADQNAYNRIACSISALVEEHQPREAALMLGVEDVLIRRFTADPELQAAIDRRGSEFWARVREARRAMGQGASAVEAFRQYAPPPLPADTMTLAEVYAAERAAASVEVPPALAARLAAAAQAKKDAEHALNAAKAETQALLGHSTIAVCGGRKVATWNETAIGRQFRLSN